MQDNSTSFKKFKKIPLFLSMVFLLSSCLVFYFLNKQINDNKIASEKADREWQIETARRDEIRSLDKSIKAIDAERILLGSHFAKSSDIVPFLDNIEQLATLAKAKPEVTAVDIVKEKNILIVDFKASGSFEAIYKFLVLLENSPYEIEFQLVDIQKTSDSIPVDKKVSASEWGGSFKVKLLSFTQ